ncbi:hypothetical protein HKX48_008744 [Thoreauomyces humboldtii]|nr:hypothetical protein HKX48_008744 [Thoreauomyces humboldtii]
MADDVATCPICLDPLPAKTWRGDDFTRLTCCGQALCKRCTLPTQINDTSLAQSTCPLCRAPSPTSSSQTFANVRRHAEAGHAWAQYSLGTKYEFGNSVPPNAVEAARWFQRAAHQGYAPAQSALGNFYVVGKGLQKDYMPDRGAPKRDWGTAERYLTLAADQDFPQALGALSQAYGDADGPAEVDLEKAIDFGWRSARLGYTIALWNLIGYLYRRPEGCSPFMCS